MTTVTLSGFIRSDPELRKAGQHDVLSFRIPVDTGYGEK
jgi:single-stranded DNA-binding protein